MSSVKKNFSYNIIFQIFTILMPFITAPYLSRILGAEGVGTYSYYFTIADYFVFFAMLGVNNYGTRSIAKVEKENRNKEFCNIYSVQLISSAIVIVLYLIYVQFIGGSNKTIALIQTIFVISGALDINWYFFGTEQFKLTTIRNVIVKLCAIVAIFTFVKDKNQVWLYTLIMASSYIISQLIMWKYAITQIKFIKPQLKEIKKHIKPMLILFIPIIAVTLYKMMDKIMLGSLTDMKQVGFFENGEKLIKVPAAIITALGTAMLPRMTSLNSSGDKKSLFRYISISTEVAECIAFAMAFGLAAVGVIFVPIYYGKDFEPCINIISALGISLVFSSWANVIRTQYLIPLGKDKEYIISVFLGAIVNVVVNIILIPQFLAIGAVVGTICAEAIVSIYQTYSVRKELPIGQYLKKSIFYFIPGIIMFLVIKLLLNFLNSNIITLISVVLIGGTVYILICTIYWYFTQNEIINIILKTIRRK